MRKHAFGLSAVILAVLLSSFTHRPAKSSRLDMTFVRTFGDGTPLTYDIFTGSIADARVHFGCPISGTWYCARQCNAQGFPIAGGVVISRN
ncbi:MAG TPA: hypothetical protein VK644_04935 [Chitinophagaceae bacterium]|nr:hypothetical protein [Chitinophagaceae bacterium]